MAKTVLVVVAHTDGEVLSCGSTISTTQLWGEFEACMGVFDYL